MLCAHPASTSTHTFSKCVGVSFQRFFPPTPTHRPQTPSNAVWDLPPCIPLPQSYCSHEHSTGYKLVRKGRGPPPSSLHSRPKPATTSDSQARAPSLHPQRPSLLQHLNPPIVRPQVFIKRVEQSVQRSTAALAIRGTWRRNLTRIRTRRAHTLPLHQ